MESKNSIVIVALPEVDDKVNRISSEKVPHLTMLYLGESVPNMDVPDIVTFVQHAATYLDPFYLSVDYRDTLGGKEADVIFFQDSLWQMPKLKEFRHQLLLNESIRRAYDNADQFPNWQPHLTLGYPESPAKELDDDQKIYNVCFDRLAVWFGDYEGPEIRLKREEYADVSVSMSNMDAVDRGAAAVSELFHHGVKGMKWGVTTVDKATRPTLIREKKALRSPREVIVTQRRAGKFARASGGQRQKATDDAVRAVAARQKAKKSTTDSLTNDELKAAVERMNLEQQYTKLSSKTKRRGENFITKLFQSPEGRRVSADLAERVAEKLAS